MSKDEVKSEDAAEYKADAPTPKKNPSSIAVSEIIKNYTATDITAAAKEILRKEFIRPGPLTSPSQVAEYLMLEMVREEREQFRVIYLDSRHHVLKDEVLFYGTLNGATVHSREVAKQALLN